MQENDYYLKHPCVRIEETEQRCYHTTYWPNVTESLIRVVHLNHNTGRVLAGRGWIDPSWIEKQIDLKLETDKMHI